MVVTPDLNLSVVTGGRTNANFQVGRIGAIKQIVLGVRTATVGSMQAEISVREGEAGPLVLATGEIWSGGMGGEVVWTGEITTTSSTRLRASVNNQTGINVQCTMRFRT